MTSTLHEKLQAQYAGLNANLYQNKLHRRHPGLLIQATEPQKSWKCLCCKDTGLVDRDVYLLYGEYITPPELDYDPMNDAPILCKNCRSIEVEITTEGGSKLEPRIRLDSIYTTLNQEQCAWLHKQELRRLIEASKAAQAGQDLMDEVNRKYAAMLDGKAMPQAQDTKPQSVAPVANVERLAKRLADQVSSAHTTEQAA